ncbi:hypothetical protein ABLT15_29735 [Paraburkholderia tropica]|uniref:hypothetical protein n=1 Tax=Paraburkholderia tropica TaxID=92647 RepID=UPI0032B59DE2
MAKQQTLAPAPTPLTFDYSGEFMRIQFIAQSATSAAKRADVCAEWTIRNLEQARRDGNARTIVEKEHVATQVKQQAASANAYARRAEAIAKRLTANVPETDSLDARSRTRSAVQQVVSLYRQTVTCRDEASRLSGVGFAGN